MIQPTRRDVVWAYSAQFFNIAAGILVLPLVLKMLSSEEIGFNYLMLNVGSLVSLFDFGFSNQFGRSFSYVFCGAKTLSKEGVDVVEPDGSIDYRLLATLIGTAKKIYKILSLIVFAIMLTAGTYYIYSITGKFTLVQNSLPIWILYCISVFLNMYFIYLNSLLFGAGKITESRKAQVFAKVVYIVIAYVLLLLGCGLLSVVVANIVSPLLQRFLSMRYFYTAEIRVRLSEVGVSKDEMRKTFDSIWYNAKKVGLVSLGSFATSKMGMFLAGIYLRLDEVASYGLMQQLVGVVIGIAQTMFITYMPKFAKDRILNDSAQLVKDMELSLGIFYILYGLGTIFLVVGVPQLLGLIGSGTTLPAAEILLAYCLIAFLDQNHSAFATIISTNNEIPYMLPALISGGCSIAFTYIALAFGGYGLWGLILAPGVVQLAYQNWKWPSVVCRQVKKNFIVFFRDSLISAFSYAFGIFGSRKMVR